MLKRLEMFIFRNQLRFRMYQKLEFTQEVSIRYPIAAYKLHTVHSATDLIWRLKGKERVPFICRRSCWFVGWSLIRDSTAVLIRP